MRWEPVNPDHQFMASLAEFFCKMTAMVVDDQHPPLANILGRRMLVEMFQPLQSELVICVSRRCGADISIWVKIVVEVFRMNLDSRCDNPRRDYRSGC